MEHSIQFISMPATAILIMIVLIPLLNKAAVRFNLTDKPDSRKLHQSPVPLTGGISILLTTALSALISPSLLEALLVLKPVISASLFLFILGVLDDKTDIKAKYKLLLQLSTAFMLATSGIRIVSFYGLFGIYELPVLSQYLISIFLITGVVNAFNLMDGVDGLAGGLSVIGLGILAGFSIWAGNLPLALLDVTVMSATLSFLKFNFAKEKIFMGDAGSLFLGLFIIASSLYLLNLPVASSHFQPAFLISLIGFFALPVLDSLRVYLGRMKKGHSPFRADKTHLHHLLLIWGLSHKKVSLIVCGLCLLLFALCHVVYSFSSYTVVVLAAIALFSLVGFLLNLNKKVNYWKNKILELEHKKIS